MDAIQEAMRELMRRKRAVKSTNVKTNSVKKRTSQSLVEAVKTRKEDALLLDLWDQVYCTLVDVGDNKKFEICGGKGKYSPYQIKIQHDSNKYGNDIIAVIYDKRTNNKRESVFFAEAEKVANKFGLETSITEEGDRVYYNLFIPKGEPVYFDLIPEKFREKIARQNGEDLDDLPVSPHFNNGTLKISDRISVTESLTDELGTDISLPVDILPESEILDFIDSVPKATKDRGPASLTFTVGLVTVVDTASKFKATGRDHIDKETGEPHPLVKIIKCSEISGLYLESYSSSKKTIAHNKQMAKYRENPEYEMEPKRRYVSWLEPVPEHRGLFRSKTNGELVLVPLVARNSRTRTKYFISIDGEPFRETTRREILPYLTPAKQSALMNGREDKIKFGPDGKEIISPAQPLSLYLNKIYRIGNKGTSIF